MPYTQEELQDVDFYREFIDKNRSDYLERIVKNASPENEELRPFRRGDGTIVSFESIDNGLDNRDWCRILYLAASLENTNVNSFSSRICDVYRNNDLIYSKYLIESHLVNFRVNKKNISYVKYILKWFRERKLINTKIIFYLIKSFLLIPFVYLKRLKYLKITWIIFFNFSKAFWFN